MTNVIDELVESTAVSWIDGVELFEGASHATNRAIRAMEAKVNRCFIICVDRFMFTLTTTKIENIC